MDNHELEVHPRHSRKKNHDEPKPPKQPMPEYEVIQPGPNPPTVQDVARSMLAKITTNSGGIIDSLIKQAATGHYQAAQYLLSEMNRLGEALKNSDQPSVVDILRPVLERLKAKQIAEGKISDPDAYNDDDDDDSDFDSDSQTHADSLGDIDQHSANIAALPPLTPSSSATMYH